MAPPLLYPDIMKIGWTLAGLVWLTASAAGVTLLGRAPVPAVLAASRPAGMDDEGHVLVFANPRCPCTRATIEQLARLQTRVNAPIAVYFVRPPGAPEGWERTASWDAASGISGVTVRADVDGLEARRVGATTSGTVVLYARDGRLLFAGGITGARGHADDNPGLKALEELLSGRTNQAVSAPVIGCPLLEETTR